MPLPPLTAERLATLRSVTDPQVSDDGTLRAVVVHAPAAARGASPRSGIRVFRRNGPARTVTSGRGVHLLPRISPSGRRLAFASDRDEPGLWRLYCAELEEAEPAPRPHWFDALPGVVEDIVWARDETALLVGVADDGSETGNARGGTRFAGGDEAEAPWTVHRPATGWRRLYRVDLASGAAVQVSPDRLTVWEFGWAGHGPVAAVVSADPSENGWYDAHVAVLDIETRTARTVHRPRWQLQSPVVAEDGRTVAFVEGPQSDRALLAGDVTVLDLETGAVARPDHEADVSRLRWTRDGRLFWVGVVSLETACGFLRRAAQTWTVDECWRGRATIGRAHCSRDGRTVVAVRQAHDRPPELHELTVPAARATGGAEPGAQWRPLTAVNAALAGIAPARETVHRWRSGDGTEIHGLLLLPVDRPATALPLVVVVHGGPTGAATSLYAQGTQRGDALLLAQAGCAVLLPNFRGSLGRGREFMAANIGDLGGGDLGDIESGVASLVAAGLADPDRVGITGASYGGYMAAWAAVRSEVFAASVPVAGLMNWLSYHNTSNVGRFDEIFLDGDPYDPAGPHLARSPVMYVRGCRTPTLLLHGDADRACPLSQAQEFYQGLVSAGCETELVVYKGAGHGMTQREQLIDVQRRIVDWFTRHLRLEPAGRS
ncbi:S9 family peptidase [Streptomyces sp. AHA2]|uniref:S9 family peptidase n=1 Tax=Streptomyces sp. AHA2 TaxID=3064526 RepID=UPI002FE0B488